MLFICHMLCIGHSVFPLEGVQPLNLKHRMAPLMQDGYLCEWLKSRNLLSELQPSTRGNFNLYCNDDYDFWISNDLMVGQWGRVEVRDGGFDWGVDGHGNTPGAWQQDFDQRAAMRVAIREGPDSSSPAHSPLLPLPAPPCAGSRPAVHCAHAPAVKHADRLGGL